MGLEEGPVERLASSIEPLGFSTSSDPQRVLSALAFHKGWNPEPAPFSLRSSRPQPLPSLKLQQNEGTLQGLGTRIKEAKTADPDKTVNRTE